MESIRHVWDFHQPDNVFVITIIEKNKAHTYPVLHYINKKEQSIYHVYDEINRYYPIRMIPNEDSGYVWVEATLLQETDISKKYGEAIEKTDKS